MKSKALISKINLLEKIFGELKVLDKDLPEYIAPFTMRYKVWVLCSCGKQTQITPADLFYSKRTSCGHCSDISKEEFIKKNFGNLIVTDKNLPDFIAPQSNKKIEVTCRCGKVKKVKIQSLTLGNSKSCRRCNAKSKTYWIGQRFGKVVIINSPDTPEFLTPVQHTKVLVKCDCGKFKKILLGDLTAGKSTSCGCSQLFPGAISDMSKTIYNEILKFLPDAQFSVKTLLPNREIDIYIPNSKLAIEYSGLIWHSSKFLTNGSSTRDFEKYLALRNKGIRYLNIYSDDWSYRKNIFLNIIKSACKVDELPKKILVSFKTINQFQAEEFLNKYHYLSNRKVFGSLYIGAFYKEDLVGVWVFKKVSSTILDWNRAAWNHQYKSWNPHEKALKMAVEILKPREIITFSDNRIFTGNLYKKLGFIKVKDIAPDYEYTDGYKRVHKFNFRVSAGIDEKVEAVKKGFYRIYDCGKIKWSLSILDINQINL